MRSETYRRDLFASLEAGRDSCGIGAVVNIDGHRDHRLVSDALSIVEKLEHRAGKDASGKVGDGVGIMTQIPHEYYKKAVRAEGLAEKLPDGFAVGMFFLPQDENARSIDRRLFAAILEKAGLHLLFWRRVPVNHKILGKLARDTEPSIQQAFIARPEDIAADDDLAFDRRLYVARREFEQSANGTYVCSMSCRTITHKGMFLVGQLRRFYADLENEDYVSAVATVHSRFSTNTTPSWERAHPYRMICHNGEINTIRGNADRVFAREETMSSAFTDANADKIFPVIGGLGSDSAMLDNTLEFFCMNGIDPALAMMMLVPEPWKRDAAMGQEKKDFYHYYATMMEPWDGPAAILFTDGRIFGATLDRNGLRPSRYYITDDNRLILASEVGVLDIAPEKIVKKSRLMPGRMLLVDMKEGRLVSDQEIKEHYAARRPYGEWLAMNLRRLRDLPVPNKKNEDRSAGEREKLYKVFGYTYEDLREMLLPMAANGVEPTASMGHDTPLAVLSERHPLLFSYFKQLFAQVTNPPIDSLREKIVTDTTVFIGSDGNLLEEKGENARVLEVENPILTGVDMTKIQTLDEPGLRSAILPITFYKNTSLKKALDQLKVKADRAYARGYNILILSDRGVDENHVPIPSLLAVSCLEQHMVRTRKRTAVSILIETGEARDVHQIATLLSFGARAVYPYLAHEAIAAMIAEGTLDKDYHTAIEDYNQSVINGIVKVASKMGISTIQSYQSARIFEAIGLSSDLIEEYFTGVVSRVGGLGIKDIEDDVIYRHNHAFDPMGLPVDTSLDSTGFHRQFSGRDKEDHLYNPLTIVLLQQAVREHSYEKFRQYTDIVDNELPHTLRGLLAFTAPGKAIPLAKVESAASIVRRFTTGAMSYGSLSREAHETMAAAMNSIGAKSNTGEGGEDPERYGTERNSAVKQVASGRFGVTSAYLNSAQEIQIKVAQGAKPGEGGHLPGKKIYPTVAGIRFSTPGVALISPPPHHDIYSIEDLAELIYDLKNANRGARINVKLVSENGVGTIACGVAKAGADVIMISGYDGGTGAAPTTSIHNAGLPWELGLAETHKALIENGLRDRVVLQTDGKLMSGRDVAIAALLGAEEFGFATAILVSMGCVMMRVCGKDTCPVGITTQNECLRRNFRGTPDNVVTFLTYIAEQLREIMARLGFATVDEMVGRSDCLKRKEARGTRSGLVDMSAILNHELAGARDRHFNPEKRYDFKLARSLDLKKLLPAFGGEFFDRIEANPTGGLSKSVSAGVTCTDRAFGTILGSEITRRFGNSLADDTVVVRARGGAGQSLGAFLPHGMTIRLEGDANDGVGKGLSGGKIVIVPPRKSSFDPSENIIVGNVALYGATEGRLFIEGIAGERFCVRNSGAIAVAEGCGDHGCEYMTGGRAVILGQVGKNFAAGMSGGVAYVLDPRHDFYKHLNQSGLIMSEVTDKTDTAELREILTEYEAETGSAKAGRILAGFDAYLPMFKKIIPRDYKRIVEKMSEYESRGFSAEKAQWEAFHEIAG